MLSPEQMKLIITKLKQELFELKQKLVVYAADPEKAKFDLAASALQEETQSDNLNETQTESSTPMNKPNLDLLKDNDQLITLQTEFETYKKEKNTKIIELQDYIEK